MASDPEPDDPYWLYEDDECWNCGGEGYIADCFDGFCVNAEDGCALCMKRCDICGPRARATLASEEKKSSLAKSQATGGE